MSIRANAEYLRTLGGPGSGPQGGSASEASDKANEASKNAITPELHKIAAKAHTEAAKAHLDAASNLHPTLFGSSKIKEQRDAHMKLVKEHGAKSNEHSDIAWKTGKI